MKKLISTTLAALFAAGGMMVVSTDADANGRHWHRGARVGVYIGAPVVAAPWWYYNRPYYGYGYGYGPGYYPPVVVQEQPSVYIEQTPAEAPPAPLAQAPQLQQQQQYWYYCQDSKTYYPHVQTCASPWQRVIPHAPQ